MPSYRNMAAFWLSGISNNFAYVVMLSAAQDILSRDDSPAEMNAIQNQQCLKSHDQFTCTPHSAGLVLLFNIFPSLCVKAAFPFFQHRIPYGVRQVLITFGLALSLLLTALSPNLSMSLLGVSIASLSAGFGEVSFLGLASHYDRFAVCAWASGTGLCGISASAIYALMTDKRMLGLSPRTAMLCMLVVPVIYIFNFFFVLVRPPTVRRAEPMKPMSWFSRCSIKSLDYSGKENSISVSTITGDSSSTDNAITDKLKAKEKADKIEKFGAKQKVEVTKSLFKYMIPLFIVYFAEYLINQGLLELSIFDCAHSFSTVPSSQYRWYQVLYQVGVFISRSSISIVRLNMFSITILPIFQLMNLGIFTSNIFLQYISHFWIAALIVFFEGIIGGLAYANTFAHIHKKRAGELREYSLSTVSMSDSLGILLAAITSIPLHNFLCATVFSQSS